MNTQESSKDIFDRYSLVEEQLRQAVNQTKELSALTRALYELALSREVDRELASELDLQLTYDLTRMSLWKRFVLCIMILFYKFKVSSMVRARKKLPPLKMTDRVLGGALDDLRK